MASVEDNQNILPVVIGNDLNHANVENDDASANPVDPPASSAPTIPATSADPSPLDLLIRPNVVSDNESSQEINSEPLLNDDVVLNPEPSSSEWSAILQSPSSEEQTLSSELRVVNAIYAILSDNDDPVVASTTTTADTPQQPVVTENADNNDSDSSDDDDDDDAETNEDDASESSDDYDSGSSEYEESSEDEESSQDDSVRTFDWTPRVSLEPDSSKPYFSSRPFQNDLVSAKFPVLRNDQGAIVALGDEWDSFLYCGRRLGRTAIPQSDGRCGPNNGPQCDSCRRLQTLAKYKILEIIFPSLDRTILTAVLRKRGGNAFSACHYLKSRCKDLPRVPSEVAFPGSRPDGIPEPCYPVSDTDAQNVVSFFDDSILLATAKMALRKNEHNLEQAVTYILDKSPEQLAVETSQDVEQLKAYEDAVLGFQLKRREKIQEVAMKLASADVIPKELRKELEAMVPEMNLDQVIPAAMEDGHGMVRPTDSSVKCTVCALTIGTKYAGSHYCPQCNHCEGCIQTKVVYKCPLMGNGGHLHPCPLQQMKIGPDRKGYICDIDGKGCLHSENHNLSYYCQECNFDVCAVCISKPAPVFYHRRLGRLAQWDDDDDEEEESEVLISDSEVEEEETSDDEASVGSVAPPSADVPNGAPVLVPRALDAEPGSPSEVTAVQPPETNTADSSPNEPVDQAAEPANEGNSTEVEVSPSPESNPTTAEASEASASVHPTCPLERQVASEALASVEPPPPVEPQLAEETLHEATPAEPDETFENVEPSVSAREPEPTKSSQVPSNEVVPVPSVQDALEEATSEPGNDASGGSTSNDCERVTEEGSTTPEDQIQTESQATEQRIVSSEASTRNETGTASEEGSTVPEDPVQTDSQETAEEEIVSSEESTRNETETATEEVSTVPEDGIQTESQETAEEGNVITEESGGESNSDTTPVEDPNDDIPVPAFDLHERIAASRWGANEPEDDNQVEVIIGSGDVRAMERRLKRKQSSDSDEVPVMRHNRPETLLTSKYASALEGYICKECPAASNVHHVESLLHIAQGNEKTCPSEAICQAVGAGKMGIAATCLLAPIYGSKKKKGGEMKCFCGDTIDSKTAPDGAVGCLNGHALHPSCAADYLLSGGNCPTCREPLYFPKVGKAEASAAEEYLEVELQRRRKEEEEEILKEQLAGKQVFSVNDIVRISSDVALCKQQLMASPGKTGWASEMGSFCGTIGRITEVEDGKVKILNKELPHTYFMPGILIMCNQCNGQVGAKEVECMPDEANKGLCIFCGHCYSCCSKGEPICEKSSIKLNWTPSTVSLIGRASSAALWDKSLVDKDLAIAAAAEQHIIRLRAEMNAITTARATVQDALGNMKGAPSIKALDGLKEAVSAFDFERARHLLSLMNHWGDGPAMTKEKKAVMETLRKGDVDTAARKIRHHNAALVEDDAKWRYAASDCHEYVVESWAKIDLLAWPSLSAPRTGYCLGPKVRFQSKQEVLGADGNIWLLVDENSLILPQFVNGKPVKADPKDPYAYRNLVGCQVLPGPKWNNDSVLATEVGTITAVSGNSIRVKFSRSDCHSWHYPSEENGPINLLFANPPAPQGWLCMTPRQVPVVRRGRDVLQCFSCGDGLISEETGAHESIRTVKKEDEIKVGQTLLVAATLEPVEVKSVDDEHVHCSFASQDSEHSICVKFRRDDLLHPCSAAENKEETVTIDGRERGRQDLFMKYGSIPNAKAAWNSAKSSSSGSPAELLTTDYASCVKGHLLHARCFQEALVAGKKCPVSGCNEPLWAPKVRRLQRDDDACCGGNSETDGAAAAEANVGGLDAVARARNENEDVDYHMDRELKMCPACFSGPLLNQNCNDMEAHHGQCVHHAFGNDDEDPCYFCADSKAIASSLMQLSGDKKVVDVLPRCPTHDCVIMFSGCMVCGHLFNETSWADLPKWDPCAKALLDVDRKKRKAASSLVAEITREAALLEYERDAVHSLWTSKEEEMELPPLPPPAMGFSDAISESDSDSDEESDY